MRHPLFFIRTSYIQLYTNLHTREYQLKPNTWILKFAVICSVNVCHQGIESLYPKENKKTHAAAIHFSYSQHVKHQYFKQKRNIKYQSLSIPTSVKSMNTAELNETYLHSLQLM